MVSLRDELQGLHIADQVVFLGPLVHVVGHLVRAEVRDEELLLAEGELNAAQFLEFLHNDNDVFLGEALCMRGGVLGIPVELSCTMGRLDISLTELLMMLWLFQRGDTCGSACG